MNYGGYQIEVRCADGLLTCVGAIDTGDAPMLGIDGDGWVFVDPDRLEITVIRDGEIRCDGQALPLLPGVYRITPLGLVHPDGAPVAGLADAD